MFSEKNPWIPKRELNVVCWEPTQVRGCNFNPYASALPDVPNYSEEQLASYFKMLKRFGFTGVQLLDTCYSWAVCGSVAAYNSKLRRMMKVAREVGLDVTLWVWAANFHGFGWFDSDIAYNPSEGYTAQTDPKVRACFEKYYDYYAELAPYCDMLIAHFFDPGCLTEFDDVIFYLKLLEEKVHAKNPDVRMSVETWGAPAGYPEALAASGLTSYLLLEQPNPENWPGDKRAEFRRDIEKKGFEVGLWGWYTTEEEADQMPAMFVNAHILKERYLKVMEQSQNCMQAVYYSEMDSVHIYNLFSLYCSGQLLIDPNRDPDELLREIAHMIWSGKAGDDMYYTLKTIEDVRSGHTWNEYWWGTKEQRAKHFGEAELERLENSIKFVTALAADKKAESAELDLPFKPWVIAKIILPHLEQMKLLCEFEIGLKKLEALLAENKSRYLIYNELAALLDPIPNYNTWVGCFGQREQLRQYELAEDFCKRAGIPMPKNPRRTYELRRIVYERACLLQRGKTEPLIFDPNDIDMLVPYNCSLREGIEIFAVMVEEKILEYVGNGKYKLVNWNDRRFDFCVDSDKR